MYDIFALSMRASGGWHLKNYVEVLKVVVYIALSVVTPSFVIHVSTCSK